MIYICPVCRWTEDKPDNRVDLCPECEYANLRPDFTLGKPASQLLAELEAEDKYGPGRPIWTPSYQCCEHCGHFELGENPGEEHPCRVKGCLEGAAPATLQTLDEPQRKWLQEVIDADGDGWDS